MPNKKKVLILTFGCRLNQADTALLYGRLSKLGYEPSEVENEKIDLVIVNTCTVTASAAQKSRQALRRARRENPSAIIAVTGCDAEINYEFWKKENSANIVIPGSQKWQIEKYLAGIGERISSDDLVFREGANAIFPFKHRPLLKIQEGCDCFCAFCIVPFARGKPRSRKLSEIIEEAKQILDKGYVELVLTGVNICRYQDGNTNLIGVVEKLLNLNDNFRIRLSSTELDPSLNDILKIMKNDRRLCRFLHVPLQHGSDLILKKMKRPHSVLDFANFAKLASSEIPGLHLGTDIICGLPGESDEIFAQSCEFIKSIPFSSIHVFRYSPRQGTETANFAERPQARLVRERMRKLEALKQSFQEKFLNAQIGLTTSFIGEKNEGNGFISGWSDNYIRTFLKDKKSLDKLINIRFTSRNNDMSMTAQIILEKAVENRIHI